MADTVARLAGTTSSRAQASPRRRGLTSWQDRLAGVIMGGPALIVFIAMFLIPMVLAVVLSFTDWNGYSLHFDFTGLDNYAKAFKNPRTLDAAAFTAVIAVAGTILCNGIGLGVAALIAGNGRGNTVLRTTMVWRVVLSRRTKPISRHTASM